ncbi:MAG: hypothetical protein AAF497_18395, partial [Planctomycetota bacterium]
NLARLLQVTDRLPEADPLSRRQLEILTLFGRSTGHAHPHFRATEQNYTGILQALETSQDEIAQRLERISLVEAPLQSILPDVERLLGPAKPVDDVLTALDEQYQSEGQPAYFIELDQPIGPHLAFPTRDGLAAQGFAAYSQGRTADGVVLFEAAGGLNDRQPDAAKWLLTNRMNRGVLLRNLGALEQARKELTETAEEIRQCNENSATFGRCMFHRAQCEFWLGLATEAKTSVAKSLKTYRDAPENSPVPESWIKQSRQLLADIENGAPSPPRVEVDVEAELKKARERLTAANKLASLSLDQPAAELCQQVLGLARTVDEVLTDLDQQYRNAGKPVIWILPLDRPISSHLDQLLAPVDKGPPEVGRRE